MKCNHESTRMDLNLPQRRLGFVSIRVHSWLFDFVR